MRTILYILFVCGLTILVIKYVGQRTLVDGSSMEPELSDGDNLIVDKITYRFREPERFDIIVFPSEEDPEIYYIKRVIGLPGETVRIDSEGFIYINEERLAESYGREVIADPGMAEAGIVLGDDEYFVLGDNRNNSLDSRNGRVGAVASDEIVGRAWIRIYPFDKIGMIQHQ